MPTVTPGAPTPLPAPELYTDSRRSVTAAPGNTKSINATTSFMLTIPIDQFYVFMIALFVISFGTAFMQFLEGYVKIRDYTRTYPDNVPFLQVIQHIGMLFDRVGHEGQTRCPIVSEYTPKSRNSVSLYNIEGPCVNLSASTGLASGACFPYRQLGRSRLGSEVIKYYKTTKLGVSLVVL